MGIDKQKKKKERKKAQQSEQIQTVFFNIRLFDFYLIPEIAQSLPSKNHELIFDAA